MDVQTPKLSAPVKRREDLTGIEQRCRIKGTFDPLLLFKVNLAEHLTHQVALFNANAVLATQNAAHFYAKL